MPAPATFTDTAPAQNYTYTHGVLTEGFTEISCAVNIKYD